MYTNGVQPIRLLLRVLEEVSSPDRYLYSVADLRSALPEMSDSLLNVLLSRAVGRGDLVRVCKGIYLYPRVEYNPGLVLAHAAAPGTRRGDAGFDFAKLEPVYKDLIALTHTLSAKILSSSLLVFLSANTYDDLRHIDNPVCPKDKLAELGVSLEDGPDGTRWRLAARS